ncbi:MAG: Stp1/IreP family PP2C-type Ser/Thr phosphatase [Chloroflexia bacterium]|nr:Stp1/IreP family PP2C-type Ser/Thr phosphatase [Chloroflexia bacterium]
MQLFKRWKKDSAAPTPKRRQGLTFGLARDIGQVRASNQDQVLALQTSLPSPGRQLQMGLFIVADGMGGHSQGDIASTLAVETVAAYILQHLLLPVLQEGQPDAIQDAMVEAVLQANQTILDEAARGGTDMGTTLTAALLLEEQVYTAHVGDSRLYTFQGSLRLRTRDHSMVARLLELGQISEEEAKDHPKRNYLYQSVGQQRDIEVEFGSFSIEGSHYMLLCSDGLWGVLGEEAIHDALGEGGDPQDLCDQLVQLANDAGGDDNISVIVVAFPDSPPPEEESAVG